MSEQNDDPILSGTMAGLEGDERDLGQYLGKVVLVVNTASKCGLTPQFEGLQRLYEQRNQDGFEVLGFPANDFLEQEPGSDGEIAEFCMRNYGVSFPMFAKTAVVGEAVNPLFARLTNESEAPEWNFAKYLIGRDGRLVGKYPAGSEPEAPEIVEAIESELSA